jgi:hypothetical protein
MTLKDESTWHSPLFDGPCSGRKKKTMRCWNIEARIYFPHQSDMIEAAGSVMTLEQHVMLITRRLRGRTLH